jgi:cyclic pyranopterin phosphate synthase
MGFRQADITSKPVSFRRATAKGTIKLHPETISRIRRGAIEKGDPIEAARLMGVIGVKHTPTLLALCHPLRIESTDVVAKLGRDRIEVSVTVSAHEKTGVEMEALTGVALALLNIWDIVKPYEKDSKGQYPRTEITSLKVTEKVKKPVASAQTA